MTVALYWRKEKRKPTILSLDRQDSILVTVVRLLERNGNILKVTGLDVLNGSPILDIKPYLPDQQELKDVRMPDWMKKMHDRFQEEYK